MMHKAKKSTTLQCVFCGAPCDESYYCYGCRTYVCGECSLNMSLTRGHEPSDHLYDPEDPDYDGEI